MSNVLITGGCGFIGSNLITYMVEKYKDDNIVNLDKLTYAADVEYLESIKHHDNYTFVQGDICDSDHVEHVVKHCNIDSIIHLAAESHVDNSISNPLEFVNTNVVGTCVLLNVFKNNCDGRFHYVSTDEIYGALGDTGQFHEHTPLAPNSPYSASKASGGLFVRSYQETFGINAVITSCSNNYGPNQHREKLIPTVIRTALAGDDIPVYGTGENVRDWLYVQDHCSAIDMVFHHGETGETYNIGGEHEMSNIALINKICSTLDQLKPGDRSYRDQIKFVTDRLGHDFRYSVCCDKIKNQLNWRPETDFDTGLTNTIKHYVQLFD